MADDDFRCYSSKPSGTFTVKVPLADSKTKDVPGELHLMTEITRHPATMQWLMTGDYVADETEPNTLLAQLLRASPSLLQLSLNLSQSMAARQIHTSRKYEYVAVVDPPGTGRQAT